METIKKHNAIREAAMLKKAKQILLDSGDLLRASDICQLIGLTHTQLVQWVKDQKVFSVCLDNNEYYPVYAFNAHSQGKPLAAITKIINIFGKESSGLKIAFWFHAANSYLAGKCPKDIIMHNPNLAIHAAKIQVQGIQHG